MIWPSDRQTSPRLPVAKVWLIASRKNHEKSRCSGRWNDHRKAQAIATVKLVACRNKTVTKSIPFDEKQIRFKLIGIRIHVSERLSKGYQIALHSIYRPSSLSTGCRSFTSSPAARCFMTEPWENRLREDCNIEYCKESWGIGKMCPENGLKHFS